MKTITHIDNLIKINDIISKSNISEENCKFIGQVILNTLEYEEDMFNKIKQLNKMNAENYNKYCRVLMKYNELKRKGERNE